MKVFISADIEGVTGISNWTQANHKEKAYEVFARRMSEEVRAAVEGARAAGAKEIVVTDAHGTGVNLDIEILGEDVTLIQRFNGHPDGMMFGLDDSFDAAMMIGYHSPATHAGNPLSHTLTSRRFHKVLLNGEVASEWLLNAYTAAIKGVPTVFASGDERLGEHVKNHHGDVLFYPTFSSEGASVAYQHPKKSREAIRECSEAALKKGIRPLPIPDRFTIEITFASHMEAYRKSFYPGAKKIDDMSIAFESEDFRDIQTFLAFMTH